MLGIKDRILLKHGICQSHQPAVVLAFFTLHKHLVSTWRCVPQQVTPSSATSQPVLAGSGSRGMPGAGLSKGSGQMFFRVVLPKLQMGIKSESVQGGRPSQDFHFPGWECCCWHHFSTAVGNVRVRGRGFCCAEAFHIAG